MAAEAPPIRQYVSRGELQRIERAALAMTTPELREYAVAVDRRAKILGGCAGRLRSIEHGSADGLRRDLQKAVKHAERAAGRENALARFLQARISEREAA